jgi:hypothetical protein
MWRSGKIVFSHVYRRKDRLHAEEIFNLNEAIYLTLSSSKLNNVNIRFSVAWVACAGLILHVTEARGSPRKPEVAWARGPFPQPQVSRGPGVSSSLGQYYGSYHYLGVVAVAKYLGVE